MLYFEGERHHAHRVVRAVKNRFGAASEVGVFEMTGTGLQPVANPSALFLAERPDRVAGSAVLCAVEGSRPLLVEVQALVSTSTYGYAKRTANGLDANRVSLLLAVLEKRAGLVMSGDDVFANVAGGLSIDEPAVDLAVVAALASSLRNRPVRASTALFGEVGLAGEVRRATHAALRDPRGGAPRLHPRHPAARQRAQGGRPSRRDARARRQRRRAAGRLVRVVSRGPMPPFHWWRTVFFLIPAIAVYTTVLGTISLASSFFDRSGRFAHKCARAWSWLILKTTGVTVEVSGLDRLPRNTSYVFASNHQSIYDIPVLFWSLPYELRILAKASLGSFPFLGWHLARTGHVLVDRKNPGADLFRQVRGLMQAGYSLFVFPEGTRSVDGRLARFRAGTFMMAIEAGLPVVPVAVDGSRFVMRQGPADDQPGPRARDRARPDRRPPAAGRKTRAPSPARCRTRLPRRWATARRESA